jgi:hypothetical protein
MSFSVTRPLISALFVLGLLSASGAGLAAPAPPFAAASFENARWVVRSYFDGKALTDPHTTSSIAFVNGRIQGGSTCGPFDGDYYLSGATVKVHAETVLSDGPCFDINLKEAQAILDALNMGERRIEQRADRIVLRDTAGRIQIVLAPAE